jgi:hypothetical protein
MPASRSHLLCALIPLALAGAACNQPPAPSEAVERGVEAPEPGAGGEGAAGAEGAPVVASDEATFDFGTVSPSKSVTHVFKLVNRGTADLRIEKVERT